MLKYVNLSDIGEKSQQAALQHFESFEELPNTNPLVIADMAETIVYANQAFKNIVGKTKENKITDLKTEPDIEYLLRTFAQSNYSSVECEIDLLSAKHKASQNFLVSIERVFVKTSEYLVLIFKGLDEMLKWESKINSLNQALDYANIPIIITDSAGRITYATAFFDKILSIPIENIYNNFIYDVISKHVDARDKKELINSIRSKTEWSTVIGSQPSVGQACFYELKLIPARNYDGTTHFILSGNDITAYITKNQLVRKNETQLRSIINNISDMLLLIKYKNGVYYFEDANENFCRTFSIDKRKPDLNIKEVIKKELHDLLLEEFQNISSGLRTREQKFSYEGRHYVVKISFVINSVEDEIIFIVDLIDITDELLIQEQLKKAYEKENHYNRLKTAILKNMSHEIRTPLNALIGYSEIIDEGLALKDYNVLGEVTHSLKDILNRILNLFSNIVEVSHIETNDYEFDFCELDINKILKSVYNKKINEALNKNLDMRLELSDCEVMLKIDWVKMEKVIFALVDNAIKYTGKGKVIIKSEVIRDQGVITIADTGIGMDKHKIKNFVEAFIQAEEGYTKYFEGAGLGLTLAYHYVEKMGGKFSIDSELNAGTTVKITFPLSSLSE